MSPSLSDNKTNAIDKASQILINRPLYLDTETTGIEKTSEIVEIAIVDDDGNQLFQSLVKPSKPIPASAMAIHGITNQMVAGSPTFPILWQKIRPLFGNQMIGAYNSEFDVSIINQSYTVYHLPFKDTINHFCIMKLYAQFRGDWDAQRRQYRYISLEKAGKDAGIYLPNTHRAVDDALLARAVLHFIANQG